MKGSKACAAIAAALVASAAVEAQDAPTRVVTELGPVEGHVTNSVLAFKGFPYAAPPVGPLRWRAPQPARPWKGVFDARAFGQDCMQRLLDTAFAPILTEPSEDCLFMNVWRPAQATSGKLPVMVYIYGGGLTRGGSSSTVYGGDAFAKQGIVVVSFNYRVGRFGFFGFPALNADHPDEPKGNYGYLDQLAALKWIKRNIAAFGGDPDRVTIVGESAGGGSVHTMMTSPLSVGLFRGAVIQSSGARTASAGQRYLSRDLPGRPSLDTMGVNFARTKGISGTDAAALAQLRALPAEAVVDLQFGGSEGGAVASPTYGGAGIDGRLIADGPAAIYRAGRQARVPLIIGATSADNGALIPRNADEAYGRFGARRADAVKLYDPDNRGDLAEIGRKVGMDAAMIEPTRFVARAVSSGGTPVYTFRFGYRTEVLERRWSKGTPHAGELAYVFNTVAPYYGPAVSARDAAVARMTNAYWANFVKTGDPNGQGLPQWSRYDSGRDEILEFRPDGSAASTPDPWKDRLDLAAAVAEASQR